MNGNSLSEIPINDIKMNIHINKPMYIIQFGHGGTNVPPPPIFRIALKIISHRLRVIKV